MQFSNDIDTMISSITQHKQRGKVSNERATQPTVDSQK
jgi:hypothetical protein